MDELIQLPNCIKCHERQELCRVHILDKNNAIYEKYRKLLYFVKENIASSKSDLGCNTMALLREIGEL